MLNSNEHAHPLILAAKLFFRCRELNDASKHTMNSFAITMLAVTSLQMWKLRCNQPHPFASADGFLSLLPVLDESIVQSMCQACGESVDVLTRHDTHQVIHGDSQDMFSQLDEQTRAALPFMMQSQPLSLSSIESMPQPPSDTPIRFPALHPVHQRFPNSEIPAALDALSTRWRTSSTASLPSLSHIDCLAHLFFLYAYVYQAGKHVVSSRSGTFLISTRRSPPSMPFCPALFPPTHGTWPRQECATPTSILSRSNDYQDTYEHVHSNSIARFIIEDPMNASDVPTRSSDIKMSFRFTQEVRRGAALLAPVWMKLANLGFLDCYQRVLTTAGWSSDVQSFCLYQGQQVLNAVSPRHLNLSPIQQQQQQQPAPQSLIQWLQELDAQPTNLLAALGASSDRQPLQWAHLGADLDGLCHVLRNESGLDTTTTITTTNISTVALPLTGADAISALFTPISDQLPTIPLGGLLNTLSPLPHIAGKACMTATDSSATLALFASPLYWVLHDIRCFHDLVHSILLTNVASSKSLLDAYHESLDILQMPQSFLQAVGCVRQTPHMTLTSLIKELNQELGIVTTQIELLLMLGYSSHGHQLFDIGSKLFVTNDVRDILPGGLVELKACDHSLLQPTLQSRARLASLMESLPEGATIAVTPPLKESNPAEFYICAPRPITLLAVQRDFQQPRPFKARPRPPAFDPSQFPELPKSATKPYQPRVQPQQQVPQQSQKQQRKQRQSQVPAQSTPVVQQQPIGNFLRAAKLPVMPPQPQPVQQAQQLPQLNPAMAAKRSKGRRHEPRAAQHQIPQQAMSSQSASIQIDADSYVRFARVPAQQDQDVQSPSNPQQQTSDRRKYRKRAQQQPQNA